MSAVIEQHAAILPSRFEWLMGLHAENYHRLTRLFHPQALSRGSYVSSLDDGLDLRLDVIERHRYTLDLGLTYCIVDEATGLETPSAQLRLYTDARMLEVIECHSGRRFARSIGLMQPSRDFLRQRLRMGSFLSRWLEYLAEQGHSVGTLAPVAVVVEP